jgi:glutamate N-acetyltransferase/amino-acid N-acetyltransferase
MLKRGERPHLQHAERRRRDLDQRHGDPARQRPARAGRPRRVRRRGAQGLRGPDAADGARRRGHDQDGALRVTGAASDAEARIAAKNIAENNLVKCSWYGGDPLLGPAAGGGGIGGRRVRAGEDLRRYGGIRVAEAGTNARTTRRRAEHMRGARSRSRSPRRSALGTSAPATSKSAQVIGIDLGPGYIKENSKTS